MSSSAEGSQKYQRPTHLGEIEITIAPREPLMSETIDAYSAIGVSRLLLRLANNRGVDEGGAGHSALRPQSAHNVSSGGPLRCGRGATHESLSRTLQKRPLRCSRRQFFQGDPLRDDV